MFTPWYETDPDCYQHMRSDGTVYEMVQAIWLDTTREDRARGFHEYCVCQGEIDLKDFSEEEMDEYIYSYGYTLKGLRKEYGDDMWSIIAECILEGCILRDGYVIADADSFGEAKRIIDNVIEKES